MKRTIKHFVIGTYFSACGVAIMAGLCGAIVGPEYHDKIEWWAYAVVGGLFGLLAGFFNHAAVRWFAPMLLACCVMLTGCGGLPRTITHVPDRVNGSLPPPASQPATSEAWADLTIKLDEARAEVNRKAAELEAKARNEAKIVDACRWLGLALIPGGIAVAIFVSRKLGIWMAAAGACCFALGILLGRMAPWVDWAAAGGISFAFLYGVGSAFTTLWTRWQTDKQSRRQGARADGRARFANDILAGRPMAAESAKLFYQTDDPTKLLAEAAALRASAATLRHVGQPTYDSTRVDPSAKAVALITGGTP